MKIDGGKPPEGQDGFLRTQRTEGKDATGKVEQARQNRTVSDSVNVSGRTREINELKEEIRKLPDVRIDRVEAARQAIEAGLYRVDPNRILTKMLEEL